MVGLDLQEVGVHGIELPVVHCADDVPSKGVTTKVVFLPGPAIAAALRAFTRPDQSEALVAFLQQRPFNVAGFGAAVQALELPLTGEELAVSLSVAGGGWDEAVSAGRNPGVAQQRTIQEVRQAAAKAVMGSLLDSAGNGYVLTNTAAYALWRLYNQTTPAGMTEQETRRWRAIKAEAFKVLNQGYGKLYWSGALSPPNAARDAGAAADRLIPLMGAPMDYATRENAFNELHGLLLKSIKDRNYEAFKVLVAKIRSAAVDHSDPELSLRAEYILKDVLHVDMYLDGLQWLFGRQRFPVRTRFDERTCVL